MLWHGCAVARSASNMVECGLQIRTRGFPLRYDRPALCQSTCLEHRRPHFTFAPAVAEFQSSQARLRIVCTLLLTSILLRTSIPRDCIGKLPILTVRNYSRVSRVGNGTGLLMFTFPKALGNTRLEGVRNSGGRKADTLCRQKADIRCTLSARLPRTDSVVTCGLRNAVHCDFRRVDLHPALT